MLDINCKVRRLYRELLRNPRDATTMGVLADALEEAGYPQVARAYRWAAENGKWPLMRTGRGLDGLSHYGHVSLRAREVYDWNIRISRSSVLWNMVPEEAQLDESLVRVIRNLKGRRYGGVHRAFILLAYALEVTCVSGSLGVV